MCSSDICLGLLAILFPPIAVWIKSGLCTADSLINLALCCLGYIPGLLHAWYIIAKYPDEGDYYEPVGDGGESRVTYYYVSGQGQGAQGQQPQGGSGQWAGPPPPPPQRGYGTTEGMTAQGAAAGGSAEGVPPSYDQAVKGDNKVQT